MQELSDRTMTQSLHEQLSQDIDLARWDWLESHVQRDAIILVDPGLELADVGVAIATDNTQLVQHWIAEQLLVKPTQTQIIEWDAQKGKAFQALIVQPYVLLQEIANSSPFKREPLIFPLKHLAQLLFNLPCYQ